MQNIFAAAYVTHLIIHSRFHPAVWCKVIIISLFSSATKGSKIGEIGAQTDTKKDSAKSVDNQGISERKLLTAPRI